MSSLSVSSKSENESVGRGGRGEETCVMRKSILSQSFCSGCGVAILGLIIQSMKPDECAAASSC